MAKNNSRVDLTLLKRTVAELETTLIAAEALKPDLTNSGDKVEWTIELNKATGLAAGVLTEAGLLMADIQALIQGLAPSAAAGKDFMEKILGGLKGPTSAN